MFFPSSKYQSYQAVTLAASLLLSGCVNATSDAAICAGTEKARAVHAAALANSQDDAAVVTGANLIAAIDAACN